MDDAVGIVVAMLADLEADSTDRVFELLLITSMGVINGLFPQV